MNYNSLIQFYSIIIRELNIKVITRDDKTYIDNFNCNYGRFVLLNNDFFALNHIGYSEIYFNPLSNNNNECSHLTIKDAIYKKIENNIQKEFNNIIKKTCNEKKLNYYHIINKFIYIFRTAQVPFSKNIIQFTYVVFKNGCTMTLEYPLFKFLSTENKNIVFGVHLEDNELEIFIDAYQSIIDMIDEEFQYTFRIPSNSNLFPEFYIIMKIYFQINKYFKIYFSDTYCNIEKMLDNLNIFAFDSYSFSDFILKNNDRKKYDNYIMQLIKHEQKQYQEELKIRQSYQSDWLFKKDNIMAKEKNTLITRDEIYKKFSNGYYNKYIQKVASFTASQDAERYIQDMHYMNNNREYTELLNMQQLVLNIINGKDGRLWFDTRIKKYCFRSEYDGKIVENDKKEMTNILNQVLQKNLPKYHNFDTNSFNHIIEVALIESISDISKQKLKDDNKANKVEKVLIFTNAIPTINGDVFDVTRKEEIFQSDTDLLFKRNRFIPTKYLEKRYVNNNNYNIGIQPNNRSSFIKSFIFQMVGEDQKKSDYIINWLAYYFKNLKKTGTALVLLGEKYISQDIFFNRILFEIFGKPYCSKIEDNNEYTTALIQDVAKDRFFINVGDINDASTLFDDTTLELLIKELLIQQSISFTNNNNENEELILHTQILITTKNPAPYLNKALSKCTVIEVADMDTILEKLDLEDEIELEDNILKDLDNFTNFLNAYKINNEQALNKLITPERKLLKGKSTPNINKVDLHKNIDNFIQAIKDKDLNYFENVKGTEDKEGKDVYEQLKNTFEKDKGYFVMNDLYLYFNAIYSDHSFKDNRKLLDLLNGKDDMFKQQYLKLTILDKDGNREILFEKYSSSGLGIGTKNLLKINGYKLPKEFTIKAGWFSDKNDNSFEKYDYENKEASKKAFEDYKLKNKNK